MLRLLMVVALLSAGSGEDDHGRLEASLLSLLGLGRRPRPSGGRGTPVVPPAMVDLYRKQTGLQLEMDTASLPLPGRHTRSANTVRSFTHQESVVDSRFTRGDKFRLLFDLDNLPPGEKITGAELRVSPTNQGRSSVRQRVLVHDIVRPGRKGKTGPMLRLLDSRTTDPNSRDAVSLDVLPAAERWIQEPDQNHGLLLQVTAEDGSLVQGTDESHVRLRRSSDHDTEQPLLFVYLDDGKNSPRTSLLSSDDKEETSERRKRASGAPSSGRKQRRKDGRDSCRRHPLYVDFADVGWNDWIVAPPGYDAYYCHGDCPFPLADHLNSTNHAIVQTLVNSVNPGAVPKACCVPTALSSISMLYVDEENKVVLKNYQDMAVMGCGCR